MDPLINVLDALRSYNLLDRAKRRRTLSDIIRNSPTSTVNAAAYAGTNPRKYSIQRSLLVAAENIMDMVRKAGTTRNTCCKPPEGDSGHYRRQGEPRRTPA